MKSQWIFIDTEFDFDGVMLISVVIPTYNRADCIEKAIISVLNQTCKNFEIIVVDDGSSDDTYFKVKKYFPYVKYFYQENKGVASARNMGIKVSKGEFIALLDSDDVFLPQKLEIQIKEFDENTGIVFCSGKNIGKNVKIEKAKDLYDAIEKYYTIIKEKLRVETSSALIKRKVFEKAGLFDESFKVREDDEFFMRALKFYDFKIVGKILIKKGKREDQLSKNFPDLQREMLIKVIRRLYDVYPESIRDFETHFYWGRWLMAKYDAKELYFEIKREFDKCIKLAPEFAPPYLFMAYLEKLKGNADKSKFYLKEAVKKFKNLKELEKWLKVLNIKVK